MAKTTVRQEPQSKPAARQFTAGWTFWLVCFVALAGPSWYFAYNSVYESERRGFVPYVVAFALAALGAGVVSYAVNTYFTLRSERARKRARRKKR